MQVQYPGPKLYAWNGRLIQKVLKFKGQDCQFVKLRSNVERGGVMYHHGGVVRGHRPELL